MTKLFQRRTWLNTTAVCSTPIRMSNKRASLSESPKGQKEARTQPERQPSQHDTETVVWRFSVLDEDGDWGWRSVAGKHWWKTIFPKMQGFETMTWAELMRASGGRKRGNNHHSVQVAKLTKQAKQRLDQILQEDTTELFSLRLDSTTRIYGIRDGRALKLLWFDPFHGTNSQAVYPVRKRK